MLATCKPIENVVLLETQNLKIKVSLYWNSGAFSRSVVTC